MLIFEKRRIALREQMDRELAALDSRRSDISNAEYWSEFGKLNEKYKKMLDEIDDAEKAFEVMHSGVKKTVNQHEYVRAEQGYAEILGQLKAAKMNSLITTLANISTHDAELIDSSDPFFYDKTDPIAVFERWWEEKMKELPSVDEVRDFLNRVGINSKGYIVYNFDKDEKADLNKRLPVDIMDKKEIQNILKANITKSYQARARAKKAAVTSAAKARMPLLAMKDADAYVKKLRKLKEVDRLGETCQKLHDIVSAYNLPQDLEALLFEHIDTVCVYANMCRDDQYRPMLEQFLRFVQDPEERKRVVTKAIMRNWRTLSNGTF